jgi:hypothetical protein
VLLSGEGFSEFASRHGNLISVKARLELKAVDRQTARILAIDRQTAVAVDLTEQLAGKTALQEAAASLAERLLPKLVKPDPEKKAALSQQESDLIEKRSEAWPGLWPQPNHPDLEQKETEQTEVALPLC